MKMPQMFESLAEVLDTSEHPYGYRFDWVLGLQDELDAASESRQARELVPDDVSDLLNCPGLWMARREAGVFHGHPGSRQVVLTRRIASLWAASAVNRGIPPIRFTETCLNEPSGLTEEEHRWVATLSGDERRELATEITAVICRLRDQIPFLDPSANVHVGLEWPRIDIGTLTLASNDVDFRVRTCEIDGEGAWARTVLLTLVPERPTRADLQRLGFSAAMHTISTGCPPARVAAYGLLDGKLTSLEVDAEWIGLQVGYIMSTLNIIDRIQNGDEPPLTPGKYCANCPARHDCPLSQIGMEEF